MSHYKRPNLPYANSPNQFDTRFQDNAALKKPLSGESVDAEINYLIDSLNANYQLIIDTAAGILPGSETLENANKFPTTNGQGVISWTLVKPQHIDAFAITNEKVHDIGGDKIINNSIPSTKLADGAVTTPKLADQSVTKDKLKSLGQNETVILASQKNSQAFAEFPMAAGKLPYIMKNDQNAVVVNKTLSEIFNDLQTYTYDGQWLKNDSVITTRIKNSSVYGHILVGGTSRQNQGMTGLRLPANQIPKGSANGQEVEATDIAGLWATAQDNTLNGSKLSDGTITDAKMAAATLTGRAIAPHTITLAHLAPDVNVFWAACSAYGSLLNIGNNAITIDTQLGAAIVQNSSYLYLPAEGMPYFIIQFTQDIPNNIILMNGVSKLNNNTVKIFTNYQHALDYQRRLILALPYQQ